MFFSGIPESVPCCTTNRQCSSGLVACMNIAGLDLVIYFLKYKKKNFKYLIMITALFVALYCSSWQKEHKKVT